MTPTNGEVPQVEWPVITIAGQQLVIRWTFYAQWVLSKRKVDVKGLSAQMAAAQAKGETDPGLVDTMVECFAAAVAENYTAKGMTPPTAEQWALSISAEPDIWPTVNKLFWLAVGEARRATTPPAKLAQEQGTPVLAN